MILVGCTASSSVEEIDVVVGGCSVVRSETTTAEDNVLDGLPREFSLMGLSVSDAAGGRWKMLKAAYERDPDSDPVRLHRASRVGVESCPPITRLRFVGGLALEDDTAVFDIHGWVDLVEEGDEARIEQFRLGGRHIEDSAEPAVQAALWEQVGVTLEEVRPDMAREQGFEVQADVYVRGSADGGELGIFVVVTELGRYYRGPLFSGRW